MNAVDLFAVQTHVRLEDYASEAAFRAKIESLMERVDARRGRDADGRFDAPALVVFPENVGTFLAIAGSLELARGAASTDAAIARIALRRLPALVATMLRHRIASPSRAVLVMLSAVSWPIYFRIFRDAARAHDAWIVAGSIVAAPNRFGYTAERYAPASGRFHNLSLSFSPAGEVVNETHKVNLVPTLEDVLGITPGRAEELAPFDTPLGRVGTLICYDGFDEPHTGAEPHFERLGPRLDALGADILAQPAANPWPWEERWFFAEEDEVNDRGEVPKRKEQWLSEGLCTQLGTLPHVRYAVNPQLLGEILDNRFDGRSYIFERDADGTVHVLAQAARADLDPRSEEVVHARVTRPEPRDAVD